MQVEEEEEEELAPPTRPGSVEAAAAASAGPSNGKPPAKTFLPLEDDEDDMGLIPDDEQIRQAQQCLLSPTAFLAVQCFDNTALWHPERRRHGANVLLC